MKAHLHTAATVIVDSFIIQKVNIKLIYINKYFITSTTHEYNY